MFDLRKILQYSVALMAFVLMMFVAAIITLKVMTWGQTVEVPNIVGKDLSEAVNALREDGLDISVEGHEHHQSIPQNAVIYQDPLPGGSVKKGRSISVVVSLGSVEVDTPHLEGEAFKRSQILLNGAGLSLGEVARVSSGSPRGSVMAQYPQAESVLQKGAKVDLLVSDGPETPEFIMPDLYGGTLRSADTAASTMALKVVSGGKGSVIVSQNPAAGYPVKAGSTLYVTLGAVKPAAADPAAKPASPAAAGNTASPAQAAKPSAPAQPAVNIDTKGNKQ